MFAHGFLQWFRSAQDKLCERLRKFCRAERLCFFRGSIQSKTNKVMFFTFCFSSETRWVTAQKQTCYKNTEPNQYRFSPGISTTSNMWTSLSMEKSFFYDMGKFIDNALNAQLCYVGKRVVQRLDRITSNN